METLNYWGVEKSRTEQSTEEAQTKVICGGVEPKPFCRLKDR